MMESLLSTLRISRKKVRGDEPQGGDSVSRSSAFSRSARKILSRTRATQKLVDRAFAKSLTMLEVAIGEIEQNTEQSDVVLELFFSDSSHAWRKTLISNLKEMSQYMRHLDHSKHINIIDDAQSRMGAEVDMRKSAGLRNYLGYKSRLPDFLEKKEASELLKQKREELKESLGVKFITINAANFNESKKDEFLSTILIHEISHAAVDTMDFMYVHANDAPPLDTEAVQGEPSPLFRLAHGLIASDLTLEPTLNPSQSSQVLQNLSGGRIGLSALAKNNADSIAYAVRALYSSSKPGELLRYYERTVGRASGQFASLRR